MGFASPRASVFGDSGAGFSLRARTVVVSRHATPHFEHVVDLHGPGVAGVFARSAAGVPHLLAWGNGSLLSLGPDGFWDIPFTTPPQSLPPGSVVGALAGDLDRDGIQDVIVANTLARLLSQNSCAIRGPEGRDALAASLVRLAARVTHDSITTRFRHDPEVGLPTFVAMDFL